MKLFKIPGLRAGITVPCFILALVPLSSRAQCSLSPKKISYDTLVTGSGNTMSTFTFPRFDPSLGTLMSVKIQSVISVAFNFSVENYETISKSYTVKIGRDDDIESDALTSGITNSVIKSYGPYLLAPADGVAGSGADYVSKQMSVLHNYSITDSITSSVANFMGAGNIDFTNNPSTYSFVQGGANYNLLGAAFDTTHFIITYQYCDATMLASGISVFSVVGNTNQTVQLNWQTLNEETGRTYKVEKSTDGTIFTGVSAVTSMPDSYHQGSYTYKYAVTESAVNTLYFRLKRTDQDNQSFYSDTRAVNLFGAGSKSLYLYPNPSKSFINVNFNQTGVKNWQIEILSPDGRLMQRKYQANSNTAHIDFGRQLQPGIYFVRATDQATQQAYVSSFVVQ